MGRNLDNLFVKYWNTDPFDWHRKKEGEYHVSTIGNSHEDLPPEDHYGPCLRAGWYKWQMDKPKSLTSEGNLSMGSLLHRIVQEKYKEAYPLCEIESPVMISLYEKETGDEIRLIGSIDLVEFEWINDNSSKVAFSVGDFKTASNWTLPSGKYDRNPTYFCQSYNYMSFLYLMKYNDMWCIPKDVKVIYIAKHNLATYEIIEKYDIEKGTKLFEELIERTRKFHQYIKLNKLPEPEPMKWCKLCDYKEYCKNDDKGEKDWIRIRKIS